MTENKMVVIIIIQQFINL